MANDSAAVLVGVHFPACDQTDCTGCYPNVQTRPFREPKRPGESNDQRLTRVNREWLEVGTHPATHAPLLVGCSETCGGCDHHHRYPHNSKTFHKCDLHRLGQSHSASSDVRVSWPACRYFQAGGADWSAD